MIEFLTLTLFMFFMFGLFFGRTQPKETELDTPFFTTIKSHFKPKPAPTIIPVDFEEIHNNAIRSCDLYGDAVDVLIKLGHKRKEAEKRVLAHIRNNNWTIQDILKADSK